MSLSLKSNATNDGIIQVEGTDRIFISSTTGNVGLGTTSPTHKLDITSTAGTVRFAKTGGTDGYIVVGDTSATFAYDSAANYAWSTEASSIGAYTAGVRRLSIDASGNLGLGVNPKTATTSYKALEIGQSGYLAAVAAGEGITLQSNAYIAAGATYAYSTNGYATAYQQNSGKHYWYTAPSGTAAGAVTFTNAMTLDTAGKLGIGNASPAAKLDVQQLGSMSSSTGIIANVTQDGNNTVGKGISSVVTTTGSPVGVTLYALYADAYTSPGSASTNYGLYINRGSTILGATDSTGNVGIGTASNPASKLAVYCVTPPNGVISVFRNNDASAQTGAMLQLSQNIIGDWAFGAPPGVNAFTIWKDRTTAATGTEYFRIDSAGRVGIATDVPTHKLHVNGPVRIEEAIIDTLTISVTNTASTSVYSFLTTSNRTAELLVQVTDSTNSQYHAAKMLVVHDGTTAQLVQYGVVTTASELGTFDVAISGGSVYLNFTATAATTKVVKVAATMLTV